jgi:hypothetical protein
MKRSTQLLVISAIAILLFSKFQCAPLFEEWIFQLRDVKTHFVENTGAFPMISGDPIPRNAFGIRFGAQMSNDGKDTILAGFSGISTKFITFDPIRRVDFFAVDGFDSVANGAPISSKFQARIGSREGQATTFYGTIDDGLTFLNSPIQERAGDYWMDFLMTEPPSQAGNYRFSVKIQFDTSQTTGNRDTAFTLPTVVLK